MGATTVRPLFPEDVHRNDLIRVAEEIARFLKKQGYWPKARELSERLKADHGAVVCCLQDLQTNRCVDRIFKAKSVGGTYRLTSRGWDLLGIAPYEPWRKRPTRALINRAINAAARRVRAMEQSA